MNTILVNTFGGPEVLEWTSIAEPVPGPRQVLIEVAGASVNYADVHARRGQYHLGRKPPFTPGIDLSGIVLQTGDDVTSLKPGDRVVAFSSSGSYAELAVADENLTFLLPDSIDLVSACAFPLAAGAAMNILTNTANLQPQETILIHGASGGVGSFALRLARILGAEKIIATTAHSGKHEYLIDSGADHVLNTAEEDYTRTVLHLTENRGVDIVLNSIGGNCLLQDLEYLAPFGRLVTFGSMQQVPCRAPLENLYQANRAILGFSFGHIRRSRPDLIQLPMKQLIDLIGRGDVQIPISELYPLKQAARAHACMEGRKITGKLVLLVRL